MHVFLFCFLIAITHFYDTSWRLPSLVNAVHHAPFILFPKVSPTSTWGSGRKSQCPSCPPDTCVSSSESVILSSDRILLPLASLSFYLYTHRSHSASRACQLCLQEGNSHLLNSVRTSEILCRSLSSREPQKMIGNPNLLIEWQKWYGERCVIWWCAAVSDTGGRWHILSLIPAQSGGNSWCFSSAVCYAAVPMCNDWNKVAGYFVD